MSNKSRFSKLIVTSLGVGYSPVLPGTLGSLVGVLFYLLTSRSMGAYLAVLFSLSTAGLLASRTALKTAEDKDPSWIVIDETVGMMISFFQVPPRLPLLVIGFALFRFFDSVKIFPLNRLEELKGEWGVLLDDVGAGLYTALALHFILKLTATI